uniref:Variable lymphocyte receptor B cassette n=1 Tax=Petromyzon marinus TaxID=7757 RepID=S4R738_PETMA
NEVDCQSKGLQAVPPGIPVDTAMLRLDFNKFKSLDATAFEDLGSVTYLGLEYVNSLQTLPSGVFAQLGQLKNLYLNSNVLATLPLGVFDRLTQLDKLYLGTNQITSLPTTVFDRLTQLDKLYLGTNQITSLP